MPELSEPRLADFLSTSIVKHLVKNESTTAKMSST
jgi:hypothetical protein